MSTLRRAATVATDFACRAAGRHSVVRAARFVLYRARLDVPNDMQINGESALQQWVLGFSSPNTKIRVVDVGANVGQWSAAMLSAARKAGRLRDLDLHLFEPSKHTFGLLSEALKDQEISLHRAALSDRNGRAALHIVGPGAGTNSLHKSAMAPGEITIEDVATVTLDEYASHIGLHHIALVKIDTEGNDLAVLRGARTLLSEQRISIAQFEYNHRWIYARYFLRDAFDLLEPLGYRLGKLTPRGVEFYPRWESDLETFVEGNYVACTSEIAGRLPSLEWWKSTKRTLQC